jgi:hypothetical protein
MVNPSYLPERYSTTRLTDGRFQIAVASAKYAELGGKGSAQLDAFVRSTVAKEAVCPGSFTTAEPVFAQGYVSIVVRCNSGKGQP